MSSLCYRYSDLESRMKDELMNVKIKFTEQSQTVAELKQEISRLETKVRQRMIFSLYSVRYNFKEIIVYYKWFLFC